MAYRSCRSSCVFVCGAQSAVDVEAMILGLAMIIGGLLMIYVGVVNVPFKTIVDQFLKGTLIRR
jgi:uncharacterized membrane protein YedE/YeeE